MSVNQAPSRICEWLFEILIPNFYSKLKLDGQQNFHESLIGQRLKFELDTYDAHDIFLNDCLDNVKNFTADLLRHYNACTRVESNLLYIFWLLSLFKPLISTLFIILFLLPLFICLCIYASSVYLCFTKHWKHVKVSRDPSSSSVLTATFSFQGLYICQSFFKFCCLIINQKNNFSRLINCCRT